MERSLSTHLLYNVSDADHKGSHTIEAINRMILIINKKATLTSYLLEARNYSACPHAVSPAGVAGARQKALHHGPILWHGPFSQLPARLAPCLTRHADGTGTVARIYPSRQQKTDYHDMGTQWGTASGSCQYIYCLLVLATHEAGSGQAGTAHADPPKWVRQYLYCQTQATCNGTNDKMIRHRTPFQSHIRAHRSNQSRTHSTKKWDRTWSAL